MYKATEILSLPIRDIKEGKYHGLAKDILFSAKKGKYYLEMDRKCLGQAEVLASEDIAGIGEDFILIEKKSDIQRVLSADETLSSSLKRSYVLLEVEVVDEAGCHLGKVEDLTIDSAGVVVSIELDDTTTIGRDEIISVCSEVVFVRGTKEVKEENDENGENKEELTASSIDAFKVIDKNQPEQVVKDEKQRSPIGLIVEEDVVSADGLFEIKAGAEITEKIFNKAKEHDAVLALAFAAR